MAVVEDIHRSFVDVEGTLVAEGEKGNDLRRMVEEGIPPAGTREQPEGILRRTMGKT